MSRKKRKRRKRKKGRKTRLRRACPVPPVFETEIITFLDYIENWVLAVQNDLNFSIGSSWNIEILAIEQNSKTFGAVWIDSRGHSLMYTPAPPYWLVQAVTTDPEKDVEVPIKKGGHEGFKRAIRALIMLSKYTVQELTEMGQKGVEMAYKQALGDEMFSFPLLDTFSIRGLYDVSSN